VNINDAFFCINSFIADDTIHKPEIASVPQQISSPIIRLFLLAL